MKPSFVRNRFVARRNLAFRDKARELSRKGAKSSEDSQMFFEYNHGATSYPTDVLPDGNQTRIKTASGIWTATYNALNRSASYTRESADGTWYSAPTRPATQGSSSQVCSGLGGWLLKPHPAYGLDLPKNITEIYGTDGGIKTAYTYTPYGLVTTTGSVTQSPRGLGGGLGKPEGFAPQGRAADGAAVSQPIQWSSEYADTDLALVYYNYRHYNPLDGRWCGRDAYSSLNLYLFCKNSVYEAFDFGGESFVSMGKEDYDKIMTDAIGTMEASGVTRELYEKELAKGIYGETVWSLPKSGGVCTANNELKITGDLKPDIKVHIYIQIDQLNSHIDNFEHNTLQHEALHVKIIIDKWNAMIPIFNNYAKKYESKECCQKALDELNKLLEDTYKKIQQANRNYDSKA